MGIWFLVLSLVPLALRGSTLYMHPHISGTECIGFSKQDVFCLLPKVFGANVHWANANHTFLTHKNPRTDTSLRDISPAKLCSTAWDGIPKGFPTRALGWLSVPCVSHKVIVWAFIPTNTFAAGSSTYPCHMSCVSKSVPKDVISSSNY
jgi:hypothetical protein